MSKYHKAEQAVPPDEIWPKVAATEKQIDGWKAELVKSAECQEYLARRGIDLAIAAAWQWGFAPRWKFRNDLDVYTEAPGMEAPALVIPHYRGDKLLGVKFRTITSPKLFTQLRGSSMDGLYNLAQLADPATISDVLVLEGPEDCALARSHGWNATAIIAAGSKLLAGDLATVRAYKNVFLIGDQDKAGIAAMDRLAKQLPAEQVIRVRMPKFKDIGDLWKADPAAFIVALRRILRFAQGCREYFDLADLLTEEEIGEAVETENHVVSQLIPEGTINMFFGVEKSGKSLLTRYFGKCVANGVAVFGKYRTTKRPVVCFDLENGDADLRKFTQHFARIGPEKIRYRTRRTGVPALDSPALLRMCEQHRPLLILDALTKFLKPGTDPFKPGEMSEFFDQLLNLCASGATVLLIHHAVRTDADRYANSHQIGAAVSRSFAIIKDPNEVSLCHVRMEGQLFRGAEPISENLIAFPVIRETGHFGLAEYQSDIDKLLEFVRMQPGQCCSKETVKKRQGMRAARNLELLDVAVAQSLLVIRDDGKVAFPNSRNADAENLTFPEAGTRRNVN